MFADFVPSGTTAESAANGQPPAEKRGTNTVPPARLARAENRGFDRFLPLDQWCGRRPNLHRPEANVDYCDYVDSRLSYVFIYHRESRGVICGVEDRSRRIDQHKLNR